MKFKPRFAELPAHCVRLTLLSIILFAWIPAPTSAQFHEDFESTAPSWKQSESDCVIADGKWTQRRSNEIETRNRFEKIYFENGSGSNIFVTHDVEPSFVIAELMPTVRLKSARAGIRLFVRVVLPHTPSPSGNGPMTTLLPGPTYQQAGKWETLSFAANKSNLQTQLKEEIWMLRRKFGADVDQRDAYIDKVVLNLYTGPGTTNVQIDDLKLNGIVSASNLKERIATIGTTRVDSKVQPAGMTQETGKRKSLVVRDGTVLLVKKKPFFPRIVQHNGEPLAYLKALGFNTIELKSTATYEQLRQALELDLWFICPAPGSAGLSPIEFHFDRVLAWSVGEGINGKDLPVIQQRIREIRQSDQREGRPIIGNAASYWSQLAQLTDILSVGLEPIGTSFLASQYSDWIKARSVAIGNAKPIWADIQTELSSSLVEQIGTLANKAPPIPIEPQQIKFLVYESIVAGSRGLRFKSRSRLDGTDPVTRLRAQTLEWINAEITQIEPWAVGGALMGTVPTDDEQLEVTAIGTNRSRLLLIQRPTHHEQYIAGDVPMKTIVFKDSAASSSDLAYQIRDTGLVSLPNTRTVAGTQIQIDQCPFSTAIVLTQDPLVVSKLTQSYERVGQQSIMQMHTELTQQWLAIMQLIDTQMGRMGKSSAAASGALNEAVSAFRTAQPMIASSSPQTALDYINRTDERLAFMRREMITGPLGMFQSKTSTPFVVHCSLIPLHWELASRLTSTQWKPNALVGGDFENLQQMSGWQNQRLDDESLITEVKLNKESTVDGQYGLLLSVTPRAAMPNLVEAPPLWITSPRINVKAGQLVRIHGWVNVPNVIQGSHDGLTITDSLGGPDMAERIPITKGWQEFVLYRGAKTNGTFDVKFTLNGVGVAMLDEVTIRAIELPQPSSRQARNQ
ncbi:MAG: hypothetical protein AB8B55_06725 [Mariniblastus sp.]